MEKIGIYFGLFNPPHMGHVRVAQTAVEALKLQKLLVISLDIAPHNENVMITPLPQQQLEMLGIVFDNVPNVEIPEMKLREGGVSRACEAIREIRTRYPRSELHIITESDGFLTVSDWHEIGDICKNTAFVVLCRGSREEKNSVEARRRAMIQAGARVETIDNPAEDISAAQLRRLLVFGCADGYVGRELSAYIRENRLYGCGEDYRALPMEKLEQVAVSLLKRERVAHVLGCRDTASSLARLWGANEEDAARAGLLHDITKALSGAQQIALCEACGVALDPFFVENPKTLHALTGSLVAQRIFGENTAVVNAIASHTTGKANMNTLEKIIYVADYMEPNRHFDGVEELRRLAYSDLDAALKTGLEMTLDMLHRQGREISPGSREALDWLNGEKVRAYQKG